MVLDFGAGYGAAPRGDNRGFTYQADDARGCRGYVRMSLNLDPQRQTPLVGDINADWGTTHILKAGAAVDFQRPDADLDRVRLSLNNGRPDV